MNNPIPHHLRIHFLPENEIVDRWRNSSSTTRTLAAEYGCTDGTIKDILRKHTTLAERLSIRARKQSASITGHPAHPNAGRRTKEERRILQIERERSLCLSCTLPDCDMASRNCLVQIDRGAWNGSGRTPYEKVGGQGGKRGSAGRKPCYSTVKARKERQGETQNPIPTKLQEAEADTP